MGLIELDKELANAVKTSLENIKLEVQTNLDSAPTSLKEINPNSSEFIVKEKKKVTYTYTTVEGEEKEAFYYRTVVKADYTQNALNYDTAYGNFTTRVTEIKDAITEKIDKVTMALQTVLDLVNTFETQEGVSMSSALGDASENTFEFLAAYGDAGTLTSLVGPGTFGTTSLENIYEIEDDEEANVDSSFLNLNNPDAEGISEAERQTIDFVLGQLRANGCINEENGEIVVDGQTIGTMSKLNLNSLLASSLGVAIKANMEKELSAEAYEFVGDTINYKGLEPDEINGSILNINGIEQLGAAIKNGVSVSAAVTGFLANYNLLADSHLYQEGESVDDEVSLYLSLIGQNSELFSDEVAGESFAHLAQKAGWPDTIVATVMAGGNAGAAVSGVATQAQHLVLESALSMPDEMVDMALKERYNSGTELTYEQRLEIVNAYAESNGIVLPESVVAEMVDDLGSIEPALDEVIDNFNSVNEQLGFGQNSNKLADGQSGPEININFAERYYQTATGVLDVNIPTSKQDPINEWWNTPASSLQEGANIRPTEQAVIAGGAVIADILGEHGEFLKVPGNGDSIEPAIVADPSTDETAGSGLVNAIAQKTGSVATALGNEVASTAPANTDPPPPNGSGATTGGGSYKGSFTKVDVVGTTSPFVGTGYGGTGNGSDPKVDPLPELPKEEPKPETPKTQEPVHNNKQEHHYESNPTGVADVPKIEEVFNNESSGKTPTPEIDSSDELKSSAILGAAGLGATTVLSGGGSSLPNIPSVPSVSAPSVTIAPTTPTIAPTPNAGMTVTTGPDMMMGQDMTSVSMSQGTLNAGPTSGSAVANNAVTTGANSNVNAQTMAHNANMNNANNSSSTNANSSSNSNNSTHTTQSSSSKGELGKGKSSYSGGSSDESSSSKSKSEAAKNKANVKEEADNEVENNNHENEIDPNATEGVLSDSAYVQMLAKEEKQVKIATATTSSVGLLMLGLRFADVITWGSLGLSAGALGLFYTTFRVHKHKKIKKLQHLIIIEREERIRKLKDRNERLIIIENTKKQAEDAVSNVEKTESEEIKEEVVETTEKVTNNEEQSKEVTKVEDSSDKALVSQEDNISQKVAESNVEVEENDNVEEPEGYGSIIIPDGDDAFQSAEEVIFGEIPDRFSKEEKNEDK